MDVGAKITSKGQLTLPKSVRETLGVGPGDQVVFRIETDGVNVRRAGDLISLAGSVPVPEGKRGTPWNEVVRQTRAARGRARR